MSKLKELQDILDKKNVIYTDQPTFLWDNKLKKIVTEEENNSNVFFQQMGVYAFNTVEELQDMLNDSDIVVIQNDSLQPSPWSFCKWKIRFKTIK